MTYQECLDYMFAQLPMYHRVGKQAYKKDLNNIYALCELVGNPQSKLKCIHVAGTNGKGTVSHLIAFALQQQGYKVGLYTSPHYLDFRERIKVNGVYIDKKFISAFITRHKEAIERIQPSFFEITVAMAFDYFSSQGTDYCVIEVGLGGRLDSTNIITPLLSVITNISLDHTDMLGETLAEIAFEKAGIIKKEIPVLIGERQTETSPVFEAIAKERNANLFYADRIASLPVYAQTSAAIEIFNKGRYVFDTELTAPYQLANLRTFAGALSILEGLIPLKIEPVFSQITKFARTVNYMGRWQILGNEPLIITDSAHNEGGLQYVFQRISAMQCKQLHIVMGMVNDKKASLVLPLFPKQARYYFAKANIPRGKEAVMLQEEALAFGLIGKCYSSTKKALAAAKKTAGKEDIILITGSIFTVAEVLPQPKNHR